MCLLRPEILQDYEMHSRARNNEHYRQVNVEEIADGDPLGTPCQVFGDPHIVTYDNKLYDYMGDCNYVLSMDCDWGEWVVYGEFLVI